MSKLGKHIESNLFAAAATGVAGGIIAALGAAWALVATVPGRVGLVPSGAVAAFNLKGGCPAGWAPYENGAGRFIIGAATKLEIDRIRGRFTEDNAKKKIEERPFGDPGGEQKHVLTILEIPKHQHNQDTFAGGPAPAPYGAYPSSGRALIAGKERITSADNGTKVSVEGGDEGHNIMPPYVALWWCEKK